MKNVKIRNWTIIVSILAVLTGCNNEIEPEQDKSIIPGIKTGMTSEEVFEVIGDDYDNSVTDDYYKNTIEYDYHIDAGEAFNTDLEGYMCFEFDLQTDTLITFGYHLGQSGSFDAPVYPYSEEELKTAYDAIKGTLSEWYGDGNQSNEYAEYGVKEEYTWQVEEDQIWAVYGVNLWAMDEPAAYENGLNEIVVSCSNRF
ncbi:MAG: hypothetical protein IJ512_01670 [Ruminococcus sp.]|nr:hypothetical protein [Ruminococcus sp.]